MKEEIAQLDSFKDNFEWRNDSYMPSNDCISTPQNTKIILKKIIFAAKSDPPLEKHTFTSLFGTLSLLILHLCLRFTSWCLKKIKRPSNIASLSGYSTTIKPPQPFDPKLYLQQNPFHSEEEKLDRFIFLREKGYTQGAIAKLLEPGEYVSEGTYRTKGSRLEEKAKMLSKKRELSSQQNKTSL